MHRSLWVALLACGCPILAQTVDLTVRVFNKAGVPITTLARAENKASLVLHTGGARPIWRDCDGRGICDAPIGMNEFCILIRNRRASELSRDMRRDALGFALLAKRDSGVYAVVYYGEVQDLIEQHRSATIDELLGYVIAHEIGHLLLGPDHRADTVMKGTWTSQDLPRIARGELHFVRAQRDRMRAALIANGPPPSRDAVAWAADFGFPANMISGQ